MTTPTPQLSSHRDQNKTKPSIGDATSAHGFSAAPRVTARPPSRKLSVPSARALAMLTLMPVGATSLPRLHVQRRQPDGTLRVLDRPTGQSLVVYTPRFVHQFYAGHRSGRWYIRPSTFVGSEPLSPGFATARAAIEALSSGLWSLISLLTECAGHMPRVVWPESGSQRDRIQ
jgi:hypothetical protein